LPLKALPRTVGSDPVNLPLRVGVAEADFPPEELPGTRGSDLVALPLHAEADFLPEERVGVAEGVFALDLE